MEGRVAFGGDANKLFKKLDKLRGDDDVDVYIYASQSGGEPAEVSWHARYVLSVDSQSGAYPNPKHRPGPALQDTDWTLFWVVEDLKPLQPPIGIGKLTGLRKKEPYKPRFRPRGPVLIKHP